MMEFEGKSYRLATEVDVGREALFSDQQNPIRCWSGILRSVDSYKHYKFASSRACSYKYCWVEEESKMKVEIDIKVPDGYEFAGYRPPKNGEFVKKRVCLTEEIHLEEVQGLGIYTDELVFRKKFVPLPWMKKGAFYAQDNNGEWWGYSEKPWLSDCGLWRGKSCTKLHPDIIDLSQMPVFSDFRDSLIEVK